SRLLNAEGEALTLLTPLFAYGKTYALVAHPGPEYAALHPLRASRITGLSGLAITCILAVLVGFLAHRRETLEAQIRERTEALQESRQMLRLVLDSIPVRVFWKDRNSRYLGCNRPFALDAGLADPEDLLGKDDYQMGWREQAELYRADDRRVMESGQAKLNYEEPQTAPDGGRLWVRTSKIPLHNAKGEVIGVLGTYEDITERKRAEETLRKLSVAVEQSPACVVITDYEGAIEYVNPQFAALTGYSLDEVLGQNPRILKSGETSQEDYQELWDTIKAGREWHGEFHNKKKDGTLYWERALISPIRDDAGNITHFIGLKEDITFQKILEDQLRQAQKMESVGRLAGGVAHDFNNMLQAILGYADLALDSLGLDHPARESIAEVQKAARRSADLTRQLLAFSRRQTIRPVILDLNNVVTGTLNMLRRLIGEHITLIWKPRMDLWTVKMDPAQMDQVLVNLAANARDAITGVGNLTIETENVTLDETYCETHAGCAAGDYVLLAVSDDGHGMDKQALGRIFEPFFTTKETGKGTGLGLAMVYGIVKQNHGFINVYSEPGKGTSFKIYLPRARALMQEQSVIADDRPVHGTETVLLVEDEEAILGFGKAILTQHGYTVLAARTPGEALALARRHEGPIHLLITDVVMPEMNGKELKDRLSEVLPDLKALYMSGYTANVIAHHGIIDESVHFLAKPFSPKSLARIVREILDQDGP
ncbi:MAG TPA: PAS domain-containing sensor histidine kinase, partial [Candidatus Hydrogenedentes bacterium]|nr:PAS domain-containing sensor histidine kinase [Candidatus Hydrogenedentota bacterium]